MEVATVSYNGSGTFQINTSGQPVVAGTVISSTAFNALTADLATGLSTAITKDGQTTTTARIPFAAGINSSLTTDSSSTTTGSIITAGGVGVAKALYVGTTANVAGAATLGSTLTYGGVTLTNAVTGTGKMVLDTSPTLVTPVLGAASATSVTVAAGSAAAPSITTAGDTNTGIFFPAADTIAFAEGGAESARINSSGNFGIGTASPASRLNIATGAAAPCTFTLTSNNTGTGAGDRGRLDFYSADNSGVAYQLGYMDYDRSDGTGTASYIAWANRVSGTVAERMRIDSSGNLLVGTTDTDPADNNVIGTSISAGGRISVNQAGSALYVGRTNDGTIVTFFESGTVEGSISVSGSTVSYNGGHLSRWAQMLGAKDESLVKGTVMSNLDEMNEYFDADGNPVPNEQLNKVKVSDVEGDANVAGVFVNWTHDEAHDVDEINMAMTGDMIIRIAQGTTVARGDLLMSAGDGTAKPQGDDIVRSKTIAKVTSTHVTCTYADGSFCVPCVLMAC